MVHNKSNSSNKNNGRYPLPSSSTPVPIFDVREEMNNCNNGPYRGSKNPSRKKYPDLTKINDLKEVSINCQQMAMEQTLEPEERLAQELFDNLENEIDLSNATLAPEDEARYNPKMQRGGLEEMNGKNPKKLKKKKSYVYEDENFTWKCCFKYCCLCLCFAITILVVGSLIILGYFFYPRKPTINLIDIVFPDSMNQTLNSLRNYNDYHPQIERLIPFQNLDFTFDFTVTFLVKSENLYSYNFTDVQMELIYPGTQETPRFHIARGYLDTMSIEARNVSVFEVPFTAVISCQDLLERGYFYNVFSSCTWDFNFLGFWKFHSLQSRRFAFHYNHRFSRICLLEDIITQLRQLFNMASSSTS